MREKQMEAEKPVWRGEAALVAAVIMNTFGVVLMLYSGSGISFQLCGGIRVRRITGRS